MSLHSLAVIAQFVLFGSIIVGGILIWCLTLMKLGYQLVLFLKGEAPVAEEPKKTFKKREPGRAEQKVEEVREEPTVEPVAARAASAAAVANTIAVDECDAFDASAEYVASARAAGTPRAETESKGSLEDRLVAEFDGQEVTA